MCSWVAHQNIYFVLMNNGQLLSVLAMKSFVFRCVKPAPLICATALNPKMHIRRFPPMIHSVRVM